MSMRLRRRLVQPSQIQFLKNIFFCWKAEGWGFHRGRWPGGTGTRGRAWCIFPAHMAARSSPTSRGLQRDVQPRALPRCDEGPRGLDLLLLWVMHPGQEDGQWRGERRTEERRTETNRGEQRRTEMNRGEERRTEERRDEQRRTEERRHKQRRGEEPDKALHSKDESTWVHQGSQISQIKPDWGQQRREMRRNCF